jgi:ribonuclease HII
VAKAATDWWKEERAARERGFRLIVGIDEAGRGPLAGPVVAACVALPFEADLPGLRDSKTLTAAQRERAYQAILARAEAVGVGVVDVETIDALNILGATHQAMRRALQALPIRPDVALIDGLPVQPFPVPQIALVKGDARSASVAAASIVAKVTRDRLMLEYDAAYPQYGFASHKGYPTPEHLALLEKFGPSPIHRRSFAPVMRLLQAGSERSLFAAEAGEPQEGDDRYGVGVSGETVAAAHLRRQGWEVLTTRYRCPDGEIDIVAREGQTLVFVEVKTRRSRAFGVPREAVSLRKRARITAAAQVYLAEHGLAETSCRFDVAEVLIGPDGLAKVNLIRNAFIAGE